MKSQKRLKPISKLDQRFPIQQIDEESVEDASMPWAPEDVTPVPDAHGEAEDAVALGWEFGLRARRSGWRCEHCD